MRTNPSLLDDLANLLAVLAGRRADRPGGGALMGVMKRARDSGQGERAEAWMRAWLASRVGPEREPEPEPKRGFTQAYFLWSKDTDEMRPEL